MHLSIVMATRNAAQFLRNALDSIGPSLGALDAEFEILVADGQSSDSTRAIAATHPAVRIVSDTDGGIYDGMNKGIAAARGEAILILNSDDALLPDALGHAISLLQRNPGAPFVSGTAVFGEALGTARERTHRGPLSVEGAMFGIPAINARLFRTSALRSAGPLQTDAGLAADRDWLLRLIETSRHGVALNAPLYFYRNHSGSQTLDTSIAGRRRVYAAEYRFTGDVLARADTASPLHQLARASQAVAAMKLRATHSRVDHDKIPSAKPALSDCARGIGLAALWRGRLAGW